MEGKKNGEKTIGELNRELLAVLGSDDPQAVDEVAFDTLLRELASRLSGLSGCVLNAAVDEPLFTIRGRDVLGAQTVREWCHLASQVGVPKEKTEDAWKIADAMDEYRIKQIPA